MKQKNGNYDRGDEEKKIQMKKREYLITEKVER